MQIMAIWAMSACIQVDICHDLLWKSNRMSQGKASKEAVLQMGSEELLIF